MKNQIFALLALGISSTAHAGYYRVIETCSSLNPGPDHSLTLLVTKYSSSTVGGSTERTVAVIRQETFAGYRELGSYEVATLESAPAYRAAYTGENFTLYFPQDVAHVNGAIANLSARTNATPVESDITDTLLCQGDL
jgi:hypothetical protein